MNCVRYKMIIKSLLFLFIQTKMTVAAPLQMLQPMQGIIPQPMYQPLLDTTQQQIPLLQQIQRIKQHQMTMRGEIQQQMSVPIQQLSSLQGTIKQQRLALQEQMFALQQFRMLQRMNLIPSSTVMNTPPILVLFPNNELNLQNGNTNNLKYQKLEEIGDDDSEIIDAEPTEVTNIKTNTMRAVLLMPNTRSFIGDFISSIPFLPIEINVPDTISWMYDGIAGIISGIRQSLPFRPQPANNENQTEESNMKAIWKINENQQMPILVIPLGTL